MIPLRRIVQPLFLAVTVQNCRNIWRSTVSHNAKEDLSFSKFISRERIKVKRSVKVVLVGDPNSGKSTLINAAAGLNICAVSRKCQTTLTTQKASVVHHDTELIFIDTPGIITLREKKKYNLRESSDVYCICKNITDVDVVAAILDCSRLDKEKTRIRPMLLKILEAFGADRNFMLILNKVDLIKGKHVLLEMARNLVHENLERAKEKNLFYPNFSRTFMISALENDGVKDFVEEVLRCPTRETEIYSSPTITDHSFAQLVKEVVRAALLEYLHQEIPYVTTCSLEYVRENVLGTLCIVVNLKCIKGTHVANIIGHNGVKINKIKEKCEKDLSDIIKKRVEITLTPVHKKRGLLQSVIRDEDEVELSRKMHP